MQIREHKLAWRWTDPSYALLPDEILAQLQPVAPTQARSIHDHAMSFLSKSGLSLVMRPIVVGTKTFTQLAGREWLECQQPSMTEMVTLSWDQEAALRTTWQVFVQHWPEFCYPASDDLVVFPESEAWVLLFHHEEQFQFGRRAVNA